MKKILAVFLAAIIFLCLAACGDKDPFSAPETLDDMVKESYDQNDYSAFLGTWKATGDSKYDNIEIYGYNDETRFEIESGDDLAASGYLQYMPDHGYVYAYNQHDGIGYRCSFDEEGILTVCSFGTFKNTDNAAAEGSDDDLSGLTGTWYLDGDAAADSIIRIEADGMWRLDERPGGDGEPKTTDMGKINRSDQYEEIYNASSYLFDDVRYEFTVTDENTMYWGGENDCYIRVE